MWLGSAVLIVYSLFLFPASTAEPHELRVQAPILDPKPRPLNRLPVACGQLVPGAVELRTVNGDATGLGFQSPYMLVGFGFAHSFTPLLGLAELDPPAHARRRLGEGCESVWCDRSCSPNGGRPSCARICGIHRVACRVHTWCRSLCFPCSQSNRTAVHPSRAWMIPLRFLPARSTVNAD